MLVTPLENAEGRRLVKSWTNLAREDVLPIPGGGAHLRTGWLHLLHELKRLLHLVVLHVVDDQIETRLRDNVHELRKHLCRKQGWGGRGSWSAL